MLKWSVYISYGLLKLFNATIFFHQKKSLSKKLGKYFFFFKKINSGMIMTWKGPKLKGIC